MLFAFDDVKGVVYVLRPNDGTLLWSFATPAESTVQGVTVAA